jgi:VCBS repeat-containing protein
VVGKPPVANPDAYSLSAGTTLTVNAARGVLANDTDAENDRLTAALQSGPAHGTLTLNADGSFEYVPNNGYIGPDSFTYVARDQDGSSNPTTVTLTVSPRQPPVASNATYVLPDTTPLTMSAANGLLRFVTDAENDALTAVVQALPSHGTLTLNTDGSFTYVPTATNWAGDSFTYTARDQDGLSNVATVTFRLARPHPGGGGTGSGSLSVPSAPAAVMAVPLTSTTALPLTDVTAQLAISLGGLTFDPTTKHDEQTVTLKNTSASPIVGPLALVLDNLSSNAKLVNQTGITTKRGPAGSPYLDVALVSNVLDAGQSVTVVLEFDSPTAALTYKARVLAGTGQR